MINLTINVRGLDTQQMAEIRHSFQELKESIHSLKELFTMNQAELAQTLSDLKTQADKTKAEIVQKVADLEAAIAAGGVTTPEVDAAVEALKGSIQGLDDLNPDAAPPAPPVA